MNDLTSFPRADPGLVPNVPVNELYERIRALITAREDWDGVLKSLLKKPDPYEDWRPDQAQFAACQFLHELFDEATIRAYFEDGGVGYRRLPNSVLGIKGPSEEGEKYKLLTLCQGRARAIELSPSYRCLEGKWLFVTSDAMAIAEARFSERFRGDKSAIEFNMPSPAITAEHEANKRVLAKKLASKDPWHLADVLFWIGFRSFEKMAEHLIDESYYKLNTGRLAFIISSALTDEPNIVPPGLYAYPEENLFYELTQGRVKAMGRFENRGRLETIPAREWHYLEFRDNPGCEGQVIASKTSGLGSRGNYLHGLNGAWFDVDFDRVEIMTAFPVPVPSRPEFSAEQIAELLRSFEIDGVALATNKAWPKVQNLMPGVTRDRMIKVRDTLG